jgi:diaminohydroxyphosphoribosylaminopyrimidine deaminase/5-amino-6-(5-phosphoribosylamino)uracil reductase
MDIELLLGKPLPLPVVGTYFSDELAMKLALQEAFKGAGFVSPNPLVGCVVLDRKNCFLASGFHQRFGEAHAEVNALKDLTAEQLRGARVFVTLEPCSHFGKTPPCAEMLKKFPIAEVIYGLQDPNPQVSGAGIRLLQQAGIKVTQIQGMDAELTDLCEHFLINQLHKRAFVSGKIATSLDGFSGLKSGESQWITNQYSRSFSHYLRSTHDAIGIGVGTLKQDNPNLNVRGYKHRLQKLVVFDRQAWVAENFDQLKIATHYKREQIILISEQLKIAERLGFAALLFSDQWRHELLQRGISSVFLEGGPKILSTCINCNLLDRMYIFQAPILLGAIEGRSWTEHLNISKLSEKLVLHHARMKPLNGDVLFTARMYGTGATAPEK